MSTIIPRRVFLTKGMGQHKEKLASLEQALRQAGIAPFNLVKVSSIFPPGCKVVPRDVGIRLLKPGQILFLVMSENATNEAHRLISAAIGLAVPLLAALYPIISATRITPAEAMSSQTQATEGIRRAWRLACALEHINPKQPERLPRLFALDGALNIENGFRYDTRCTPGSGNYCASHIGCSSGCGGGSDSADGDGGSGSGCGGGD